MKTIEKTIAWAFLGVLAYLPFHALISTYLISRFGNELFFKSFKDLIVVLVFMAAVAVLVYKKDTLKTKKMMLFASPIMLLTLTVMAHGILNNNQTYQEKAFGILLLLRPLWIFFIGVIAAALVGKSSIEDRVFKVIFVASAIVVAFGALQVLVLPKDFLTNFGYSESTIKPYQTIDNNESFVRILSTLRGPNPLGAYMSMMAPVSIYYISKIKNKAKLKSFLYAAAFLITIYGAQSRSAWLGLVVGISAYLILITKNKYKLLKYGAIILPTMFAFFIFKDTYIGQNILFHTDPNESNQVNSDNQRASSLKYAIEGINDKPFGHGIGSSGPASYYGNKPVIIENQYLDTAYQIGWLGLVFYLLLLTHVGVNLLKTKTKLSYAVLSGLMSVSIIAMFWPVWTDETITLIWWGLAGVVLSTSIVQTPKKR
jgi:hypothetical protein